MTPRRSFHLSDALALIALTLAVLVVYARVLFTPLIPASGDFLAYFAPYWQLFNQTVRAGRLPLWNAFIFAGAPFQANPQTEVFYPLRWPMVVLSAEKGILLTAALHVWLAGIFAYFLVKALLREDEGTEDRPLAALPPLIAALIIALNGWVTGLLLHPNQLSTYPWLIAAILLWEKRPRPGRWPRWDRASRRWFVGMTLVWALAFLAGHTQSFYNAAVIFGLWVLGDMASRWYENRRKTEDGRPKASVNRPPSPVPGRFHRYWRAAVRGVWYENRKSPGDRPRRFAWLADYWPVALLALLAAGWVAAAQLLPTLELSGLSYRQGGMAFRDHAALSLPPWWLGFTLLPHYARDLGMALGTEAYGEWLAYVGLAGLILALLGLRHASRRLRFLGVFLTLAGLLLAFGAYDPLEYILFRIVPGWDLFRVPARFLQAAVLGIALLAALGSDWLLQAQQWQMRRFATRSWAFWLTVIAAGGMIALAIFTRPNLVTLLGWAGVLLFFLILLTSGRRKLVLALPVILFLELYLASYTLPVQHPTAPQALRSWRTAPARIASELGPADNDAACRTVSLSTTTWDPGDLADLQRIYGPYLDDRAFTDLVNATKAREVVAPNIGVLFGIPSLDGFGGGVLPTERFTKAMSLFLPPENIVADGRLREQLHSVPAARLLSPFNVCYVIADKNFDVWHDDIYYDLAFGEPVDAAQPGLSIEQMPVFPASGLGLVSHLGPKAASLPRGEPVAEAIITFYDNSSVTLPIRAGIETAVGEDAARPASQDDLPAVRWPRNEPGQDAIAELDFPPGALPARLSDRRLRSVRFQLLRQDAPLFIRGMAVYDRASGAHATPIVTREDWERIHSGDVKIYRNHQALPRAFAVSQVRLVEDADEAVRTMRQPAFNPAQTAVVEQDFAASLPEILSAPAIKLQILEQTPERLRLHYRAADDALLIIADAWHPGWVATLDPGISDAATIAIFPADIFLKGLVAPAGEHDLILEFRPASLHRGELLSLMALVVLGLLWVLPESKH